MVPRPSRPFRRLADRVQEALGNPARLSVAASICSLLPACHYDLPHIEDPMPFLTEPEPERGAVLPVMPGITRIVAANPGPMTYHGTNTYLIDTTEGLVVLDPGPEGDPEHVAAILRATGPNVALILVSHTHHDHV